MAKDQSVDNTDMQFINKANILIEALPYIQKLWGKTIVIKYGGNAMVDPSLTRKILEDVTLLKYAGRQGDWSVRQGRGAYRGKEEAAAARRR